MVNIKIDKDYVPVEYNRQEVERLSRLYRKMHKRVKGRCIPCMRVNMGRCSRHGGELRKVGSW